jgi:trans-aconitate methyltransferase
MSAPFFRMLAKHAAARYPARDVFARRFAFGKLTGDPVFHHLLAHGVVPPNARIVDLGSGQGVLSSLLHAARERHAAGDWPAAWPAPANPRAVRGIELMARDVERARRASPGGDWQCGDIRTSEFGAAEAVVILDVLHYIDYDAQAEVLKRVRASLAGGGVLILRVGDESKSLRFRITIAVDRAVMRLRGHKLPRLYCKPLEKWQRELADLGFRVQAVPMSAGTPFANVLLVARFPQGTLLP